MDGELDCIKNIHIGNKEENNGGKLYDYRRKRIFYRSKDQDSGS